MVPNGWKLTSLGEVCSGKLQTGPFGSQLHAHEYTEEGVPVLMPKDLINFRANHDSAAKIPVNRSEDLKKHILKSGDILFSRRGDVARFALIESDLPTSLCGTGCLKATPNKAHSPLFLSYFLQKNAVKKWLEQNAVGQTMPNMNTAILAELPLMVASCREEEDKIAQILSTWDRGIATTEKLIDASKQQKKALMQQLLTGKKRLIDPEMGKAFEGEWEELPLGDLEDNGLVTLSRGKVISKKDIEAFKGDYPIYSSSVKQKGMMGTYGKYMFDEELISWSVDGGGHFFHRPKHKFSITNVSGYMRLDISRLNYKFIAEQLSLHHEKLKFDYQTKAHPSVIRKLYVLQIPSISEQQKIASVLTAADKEIESLEAKLAHFKQEKKALMQQLLTGKRRVKVAEAEAA
ncbi:TPA: restriction endonuclease subunit S [Vibrio parahaemolyticus]|nr:restriction endonuclease subunit S [Vibrio parahaemolyticus]